jgi:hypothetical protein
LPASRRAAGKAEGCRRGSDGTLPVRSCAGQQYMCGTGWQPLLSLSEVPPPPPPPPLDELPVNASTVTTSAAITRMPPIAASRKRAETAGLGDVTTVVMFPSSVGATKRMARREGANRWWIPTLRASGPHVVGLEVRSRYNRWTSADACVTIR